MLTNHVVISSINIVLLLIILGLFIPIAVLFLESTAALLPRLSENQEDKTTRPSIAVLIPAHNEASVIGTTLQTLIPQLKVEDRLIVIADNCSDETAAIAREYGTTVIERQDTNLRGKGYALNYGLRFLETNPPEVVISVDADCIVHQGAIEQLAQQAKVSGRPAQAINLLEQPARAEPKDHISALAFMVKNLVRPLGLQRLGLPCLLTMGNAFPWSVICQAPLASDNIVEDMQLGLDLALAGNAPLFCPSAKVTGTLPQQQKAVENQRMRWEHGHLHTLISQVPRLVKASFVQRRFALLAIALDLCVPPLALLVIIWTAMMATGLLMGVFLGVWFPSFLLSVEGLLILTSIITAWAKFGSFNIPKIALVAIPFYIVWKIPIYLAFLIKPQTKWIHTEKLREHQYNQPGDKQQPAKSWEHIENESNSQLVKWLSDQLNTLRAYVSGTQPIDSSLQNLNNITFENLSTALAGIPDKTTILTFDDGPDPKSTQRVLSLLERYNIKATFFVTGRNVEKNPELLREIVARSHEVGVHTYSHPLLTKLSDDQIRWEISATINQIKMATGDDIKIKWFRAPYGALSEGKGRKSLSSKNSRVVRIVDEFGLNVVQWSKDSKDWSRNSSSKSIAAKVKSSEKQILLLHDGRDVIYRMLEEGDRQLVNKYYSRENIKATPIQPNRQVMFRGLEEGLIDLSRRGVTGKTLSQILLTNPLQGDVI